MMLSPADLAKRAAAEQALELVKDGMRLGLGTGSTAAWFVRGLGERMSSGLRATCVATSSATVRLADEVGIPLAPLDVVRRLDLTVDGADELDPDLNLIKGGGGALLQEKIVAAASDRLVILVDASKRVGALGAFPLAVEVVRFGWPVTQSAIEAMLTQADVTTRRVTVRRSGPALLVTDEGHHILDLHLGRIGDPAALAAALNAIPGVVEHGLFLGMAERALIGHPDGVVEHLMPRSLARADYLVEIQRSLDS